MQGQTTFLQVVRIKASHLFSTQSQIEAVEISEAFAGEAGAAVEGSDVGQRREVIVQQNAPSCLHVQCAVTETSCVGLKDREYCVFCGWNNLTEGNPTGKSRYPLEYRGM